MNGEIREYDINITGGGSRKDIIKSLQKLIKNIKAIDDNPEIEYQEEWEDKTLFTYFG